MTRYIITRHHGLPGVRLSKPGHWGNLPFANDGEAVAAAKLDARPHGCAFERPPIRKLREVQI